MVFKRVYSRFIGFVDPRSLDLPKKNFNFNLTKQDEVNKFQLRPSFVTFYCFFACILWTLITLLRSCPVPYLLSSTQDNFCFFVNDARCRGAADFGHRCKPIATFLKQLHLGPYLPNDDFGFKPPGRVKSY